MKIWILEIGEPLPVEPDVRMHRYGLFSRALAEKGHDVTWWTSTFSHTPKVHFADRDHEIRINGVLLRMIRGPGYRRNVSLARVRHNRHFAQRFAELARTVDPPDLIISPIPIIEAAKEAVLFGQERGIPVLTDIRDLWPDELRDRAPKPLRWLARLMLARAYHSMRFVCENATGIMGVSDSYRQYGLRFAGRELGNNDILFPLGYSQQPVAPEKLEQGLRWCQELGIRESSFVVCFFGTIGKFFDLETVIASARILEREMDIQFVLGGAGSGLEPYKRMAAGVKSVLFPGWLDAPKIQATMKLAKLGLAPYRKDANMALPNKVFEYMAGGLPLLASIRNELPALLRQNDCGRSYRADSVDDLCAAIRWFAANPERRRQMGENARRLLVEQFSTEKVFERVERELVRIVGGS